MARARVHLEISSGSPQTRLLCAGLAMLHQARVIRLSQQRGRVGSTLCLLRTEGTTVAVDLQDGSSLLDDVLDRVDAYAKRSYRIGGYESEKVFPFGLNYPVYPPGRDLGLLRRSGLPGGTSIRTNVFRAVGLDRLLHWPTTYRVGDISPRPAEVRAGEPAVVFFTRVWRERDDEAPDEPSSRTAINHLRAGCVRQLRSALGPRFIGGLAPTRVAVADFADCVVDPGAVTKQGYFTTVANAPIGVTTAGLRGSVGWKFGEFVAFGRAVVSQALTCEIPGEFSAGANYAPFRTPDECVEACVDLLEHPEKIDAMSRANARYYDAHLRPDRVVSDVLDQAARIAGRADVSFAPDSSP